MSNKRPEHSGPPEYYYDDTEADKYTNNSRIIFIQSELTKRAYELLELDEDEPKLILDIGCGSALSSQYLSEMGHHWVGVDISKSMLDVALERSDDGNLILSDMGQGLPFRPGMFDAVISISAVQWLCVSNSSSENPVARLYKLFTTLFAIMTRNSKAVFQIYPENDQQLNLIQNQALKAGFVGGTIVDFPQCAKKKKIFLILFAGGNFESMPKPLKEYYTQKIKEKPKKFKIKKGSKAWILKKKEKNSHGLPIKHSKYTGRKRKDRF
ncbi:Bud site selection protein 23 [Intoshia linei]|uniref:18S rRNA (guanine-N(7))-methyltransferase n=1 Tax=Intoshia linei TaxID=1819745 RepID=A0A177AYF0_9BILA|nr:Bud site selection protein 23 [Intoshia linei]